MRRRVYLLWLVCSRGPFPPVPLRPCSYPPFPFCKAPSRRLPAPSPCGLPGRRGRERSGSAPAQSRMQCASRSVTAMYRTYWA